MTMRLYHLDPMDLVRMTCGGCGRVRDWPSRFLALSCGENSVVAQLERRLRCHVCQNKAGNTITILAGQVDLQGAYFAYQDDAGIRK